MAGARFLKLTVTPCRKAAARYGLGMRIRLIISEPEMA